MKPDYLDYHDLITPTVMLHNSENLELHEWGNVVNDILSCRLDKNTLASPPNCDVFFKRFCWISSSNLAYILKGRFGLETKRILTFNPKDI